MIQPGHEASPSQPELPLVLIGQRPSETFQETPRLEGNLSLFHALLPNNAINRGFIRPAEEQWARALVRKALKRDPEAVASCQGKTHEEARAILEGILDRLELE